MVLIYKNKDINKDIFDLINYHYCVIIAIDSYNILKFYPHECNFNIFDDKIEILMSDKWIMLIYYKDIKFIIIYES